VGLNHRPTVYETVALPLSYIGFRLQPRGTQGCANGLATINHTIILGVVTGEKKNVAVGPLPKCAAKSGDKLDRCAIRFKAAADVPVSRAKCGKR
jgi:hypothetical protein